MPMKTKKALKRLKKIETLLADIIARFPSADGIGTLLHSAKTSVGRATRNVNAQLRAKKKPTAKSHSAHAANNGRKRTSIATRKPSAVAKRKSGNGVTVRHLKTA